MITKLENEYRPLSNFWYKDVYVPDDRLLYATNEHAYQASKTLDLQRRVIIRDAKSPSEAKSLGNNKDTILREDWDTYRRIIMLHLLRTKFAYSDMEELLLSTGNQKIIEGNHWHDNFWGVCSCQSCTQERIIDNTLGKNWLGKLLMFVRLELQIKRGL